MLVIKHVVLFLLPLVWHLATAYPIAAQNQRATPQDLVSGSAVTDSHRLERRAGNGQRSSGGRSPSRQPSESSGRSSYSSISAPLKLDGHYRQSSSPGTGPSGHSRKTSSNRSDYTSKSVPFMIDTTVEENDARSSRAQAQPNPAVGSSADAQRQQKQPVVTPAAAAGGSSSSKPKSGGLFSLFKSPKPRPDLKKSIGRPTLTQNSIGFDNANSASSSSSTKGNGPAFF